MFKLFGCRPYQGYHWQSEILLLFRQDIVQPLNLNYIISEEEKKCICGEVLKCMNIWWDTLMNNEY